MPDERYWCTACGQEALPTQGLTTIDPRFAVGRHCGSRQRHLTTDRKAAREGAAVYEQKRREREAARVLKG